MLRSVEQDFRVSGLFGISSLRVVAGQSLQREGRHGGTERLQQLWRRETDRGRSFKYVYTKTRIFISAAVSVFKYIITMMSGFTTKYSVSLHYWLLFLQNSEFVSLESNIVMMNVKHGESHEL